MFPVDHRGLMGPGAALRPSDGPKKNSTSC
jgi:hypothetical protein